MNNQEYEQEFDLKDLIFYILHRWRGIVITACLLAVLLGGYKLSVEFRGKLSGPEQQQQLQAYNEDLELYENEKLSYEELADNYKEKLKIQNDYSLNSILMQLSPYSKPVASVDLFVRIPAAQTEDGNSLIQSDEADGILKAYESLVKSAGGIETVAGKPIAIQYLQEAIKTTIDYDGNMLNVEVAYTDEAGAKEILDVLINNARQGYEDVQKQLGAHELVFMNQSTRVIVDSELALIQKDASDSYKVLMQNQKDNRDLLNKLTKPSAPHIVINYKNSIKYGIIGGVLGGFLATVALCVVFLLNKKVKSDKELSDRFGLKVLGVFNIPARTRMFVSIDRWLDKLEGKKVREPSSVYDIIGVNIKNYMEPVQDIMVIGSVEKEKLDNIGHELNQRLPGVEVRVGAEEDNLIELLKLIPKAGEIVLVQERGKTRYSEVQSQIELIQSLGKKIIGCIVL